MPRRSSGGLEKIQLDGGTSSSNDKRVRVNWSVKENNLLVSAWLNISKDSIHEVDKLESYWKRITSYYNEIREEMPERAPKQLKDHWLKLKQAVCKFAGCYNLVIQGSQSSCPESQIIEEAHALYNSDVGKPFTLEYVWRLLKDEPRWRDVSGEHYSKRAKISESGAYTSSSNMETPTSPKTRTPPLECPMSQKAEKSKSNATEEAELGTAISRSEEMHETTERKFVALELLALAKQEEARAKQEEARAKQEEARAKQEEARAKQEEARALAEEARAKQQVLEYEILMKDTSKMTEAQQRDHNRICDLIRQKLFGM